MLRINKKRSHRARHTFVTFVAILLMGGGLYLLSLIAAPAVMPVIAMKPIEVNKLPKPTENRVVIPKIGVNIVYGEGVAALDRGAQWRFPDRGNPEKGGNFIIAAHRFTLQPTPQSTLEKSPFYNIDKLVLGDKIVIDYDGKRYGYEIDNMFSVEPTQIEIEDPSKDAKLTLYSCELDGSASGRVVVTAKPLGLVALKDNN